MYDDTVSDRLLRPLCIWRSLPYAICRATSQLVALYMAHVVAQGLILHRSPNGRLTPSSSGNAERAGYSHRTALVLSCGYHPSQAASRPPPPPHRGVHVALMVTDSDEGSWPTFDESAYPFCSGPSYGVAVRREMLSNELWQTEVDRKLGDRQAAQRLQCPKMTAP